MDYYRPINTNDGLTLSIDGLVIDYYMSNPKGRDEFAKMLSTLDLRYAVNSRHWSSLRIGTFRENLTLTFADGSSFYIGLGLNEAKPNFGRIRLDANPNHCVRHQVFQIILGHLNMTCKKFRTTVRRFDLAIDLEADRADVELLKDHRAPGGLLVVPHRPGLLRGQWRGRTAVPLCEIFYTSYLDGPR